ncbi:SDR family NAD(P)-dependent oxidoreductase [Hoeflea sp. YIM 152468]|uniref:SDR family NAD(P)-dependent oxidoreductase n=1 Tax=Hoeflea sp. YIM 152468 TaxID=3031759 RepID=UPI0023DA3B9F|nr:SDR family NAD(P)-dependent oxidoreductase [Hoeflea sp. YIM 152468]MDF1607844.1 SDR family NAD(P)-dependent oxidoreductase [Hoeflea sp. YIM 152468]
MTRVAVITGGAGGLGQAFTRLLLKQGWQVVLVDLPTALEAVPQDRANVETLGCDLTDEAAVAAACEDISERHPALDLVIHNAGVTQIGLFDETTLASQRRVMEINYFGSVRMAAGLLKAVRAGRGTHLAVASVAGFAPLYKRTAYAASKHALTGFFASLATEEAQHGVSVVIAAPSFVATNPGRLEAGTDGIGRPGAAVDGFDEMTPDRAAEIILKGWRRGQGFIPVGRVASLVWRINRLSPRLYRWLMMRKIRP